jgi:hypothetical protein
MSILTLVKTQRKDPRISVRVEFSPTDESHAKQVEAICQSAMDRISEAVSGFGQETIPFESEPPVKTRQMDGQGNVLTEGDIAAAGEAFVTAQSHRPVTR